MAARDRFMQGLMTWQGKQDASEKPFEGPMLTEAARFSLLLDGIKLIGTGNGAGGFASVVALYYFSSRPELHFLIKIAAIFFVVGLLIFAVAVGAYVLGLSAATRFIDQHTPATDPANISVQALNSGIDGLMALVFSLIGAVLSWACFFIGTAIGLYVIVLF